MWYEAWNELTFFLERTGIDRPNLTVDQQLKVLEIKARIGPIGRRLYRLRIRRLLAA